MAGVGHDAGTDDAGCRVATEKGQAPGLVLGCRRPEAEVVPVIRRSGDEFEKRGGGGHLTVVVAFVVESEAHAYLVAGALRRLGIDPERPRLAASQEHHVPGLHLDSIAAHQTGR